MSASDGLILHGSLTVVNDTTTYIGMPLYDAGVFYCSLATHADDTGSADYSYGWAYARLYSAADGWANGASQYDFNQIYSAGNAPTAYTNKTSAFQYMAVANQHSTVDEHQWGVTRIEYRNMDYSNFTFIADEFCSANDTNVIPSGRSVPYGKVDGHPPYEWIGRGGGTCETSNKPTHIYFYISGNSITNYAPGSRISQFYWNFS